MGAEALNSEVAVKADEDALETSRADARVLLWFATREGRKVGEKVLRDVVSAEVNLREGKQTPEIESSEIEANFWTAYRDLAAAVKPASVESILSTCRHPFGEYGQTGESKLGNARKTKYWYTAAAVSVLFALLLIQTYWFVVTGFSANLEKHRDELDGIAGAFRLMNVLAEQISHEYQMKQTKGEPPSGSNLTLGTLFWQRQ